MGSIIKIASKIRSLFASEEVTEINAADLKAIPLNVWQYINNRKIRYKIVERGESYCVSITEWLEDDTFNKHFHRDANEIIFVINGKVESSLDGLKRGAFNKLFYSAGTIHEVKAKKGTLIAVKFDFV